MEFFGLPLSDTQPQHLTQDEVAAFALRTGWLDDIGVISPASTLIERRALSWWPGHDLFVARDPHWNGIVAAWVLEEGGRLTRLNGTSPPIHELNGKVAPVITPDNALAYLGFFCTFVHGNADGRVMPFALVRSAEDAILPRDLDRDRIATFIREPVILKQEPSPEDETKVSFHIEVLVYYADALFLSNFAVRPTGMVDMLEDEPLVAELEAFIEMPMTFTLPEAPRDSAQTN